MPTDTMMIELYGTLPKTTTDGLQAMKEFNAMQVRSIREKASIAGLAPNNEHIRQITQDYTRCING